MNRLLLLGKILLPLTVLATTAGAANRVGDADNDGDVDLIDAGAVQARVLGTIDEFSISPLALADGDGDLDLKDMMLVAQAATGQRVISGPGGWLSFADPTTFTIESGMPPTPVFWGVYSAFSGVAENTDGLDVAFSKIPAAAESLLAPTASEVSGWAALTGLTPINTTASNQFVTLRLSLPVSNSGGSALTTYLRNVSVQVLRSICGNGFEQPGEQCDDGNLLDCDGCKPDCSSISPICGDGLVTCDEACDDGNALVGDGCSAACQDETEYCQLAEVATLGGWGTVELLTYDNNRLYVYERFGVHNRGIVVYDVSSPDNPVILGNYPSNKDYRGMEASGSYLYLGGDDGLTILNVSNPASITQAATINQHVGNTSLDIAVEGNYAFVAVSGYIDIYNISNPSSPVFVSTTVTTGSASSIDVFGNYAYVGSGSNYFSIVDATNKSAPVVRSTITLAEQANDVAADSNTYAYVSAGSTGVIKINVNNPLSPSIAGTYNTPGSATSLAIAGSTAYVADGSPSLTILSIAGGGAPSLLGTYQDNHNDSRSIAVGNGRVFLAEQTETKIVNASTPSSPVLTRSILQMRSVTDVAVFGNMVYLGEDQIGLVGVDATNPVAPVITAMRRNVVGGPNYSNRIVHNGSYLFSAVNVTGVQIFSTPTANQINLVSTLDTPGSAGDIAIQGNRLYIADGQNGLVIADISNPATPFILGTALPPAGMQYSGVTVEGGHAYLTRSDNSAVVIDVSTPSSPVTQGVYTTAGTTDRLAVQGGKLYMRSFTNIAELSVLNPLFPSLSRTHDDYFESSLAALTMANGYLITASQTYGAHSTNFNPTTPVTVANINTAGSARDLATSGRMAYVADETGGLSIIQDLPGLCLSTCGNGHVESSEACDDGDTDNCTPGCNSTCSGVYEIVCGDGWVECGEACDMGDLNGATLCGCQVGCQYASVATLCRASTGVCDPAENCTGTGSCPADQLTSAGTQCRASAGVCDPAEACTGLDAQCPVDAKSTAVCRPVADVCDVAESCDGLANECPTDGFEPATLECRPTAGQCDLAENCTGIGPACPADLKATMECRAAVDVCDAAESCDGLADDCPADALMAPGTECRATTGECDPAEACDGLATACPADGFLPDGTACTDDGLYCTGTETCQTGLCASGGDPCTPEICSENSDACAICGDGAVQSPEEECDDYGKCDDGTLCGGESDCTAAGSANCQPRPGDGCTGSCVLEFCGDGTVNNDLGIYGSDLAGRLVDLGGGWQLKDAYFTGPSIFESLLGDTDGYGLSLDTTGAVPVYQNPATPTGALVDWAIHRFSPTGPIDTATCAPSGGGYSLGPNGLTYSGATACHPWHSVLRGTASVSVVDLGAQWSVSGTLATDGLYHWVTSPPTALPPELSIFYISGDFDSATGLGSLRLALTPQESEECDDGGANSDTAPDACRTDCRLPSCGDGVTDTGEDCDDGNFVDGDGCDPDCLTGCFTCGAADTPNAEQAVMREGSFDGGVTSGNWTVTVSASFNGGQAYRNTSAGAPLVGTFTTQSPAGTLFYVWHLGYRTALEDRSAAITLDGTPLVYDGSPNGVGLEWQLLTPTGIALTSGAHSYEVARHAGADSPVFFDGLLVTTDPLADPSLLTPLEAVDLDDPGLDFFQPFVPASCCGDGILNCAVGAVTLEEACDDGPGGACLDDCSGP